MTHSLTCQYTYRNVSTHIALTEVEDYSTFRHLFLFEGCKFRQLFRIWIDIYYAVITVHLPTFHEYACDDVN